MAKMLKLSAKSFKITTINIMKNLLEKMDSWHEQMGNFSREKKTIKNITLHTVNKKLP